MKLYMIISADKYELPLAVRDTAVDIAKLLGRQPNEIYVAITKKSVSQDTYNGYRYRIIKVMTNVEDEDG